MLETWRQDPDYPLMADLRVRSDKALQRGLYRAARIWLPRAREYRAEFLRFTSERHIKGSNVENVLVRLLFGRLKKQRVTDYVTVLKYWYDHPDAPLAEAEATVLEDIQRGEKSRHAQRDYIITPPEFKAFLEARICARFDGDPFPHPRPNGYDGLAVEWHGWQLCNAPFTSGMLSAAARKAIEEVRAGRAQVCFIAPTYEYTNLLFAALANGELELEVVPPPPDLDCVEKMGRVKWQHRVTGEPMKGPPNVTVYILRCSKKHEAKPANPPTQRESVDWRVLARAADWLDPLEPIFTGEHRRPPEVLSQNLVENRLHPIIRAIFDPKRGVAEILNNLRAYHRIFYGATPIELLLAKAEPSAPNEDDESGRTVFDIFNEMQEELMQERERRSAAERKAQELERQLREARARGPRRPRGDARPPKHRV